MGQGFLGGQVNIPGQANNFIMPFEVKLNNKVQIGDKLKFSYTDSYISMGSSHKNYKYIDTETQTVTSECGNKTLIPISLDNQAIVTLYNYQNSLYATLETLDKKDNLSIQRIQVAANIDYTKDQAIAATKIINMNAIGILYITQNSSYLNYCELTINDDASGFEVTKQRPTNININNIAAFDLVCKDQKQIFISWKNKDAEVAKIQHHSLIEDDGEYMFSTSGIISLSTNTAALNADGTYILKMASHDGNVLVIILGGQHLYSNLVYFDAGILRYQTEKLVTDKQLVIDKNHTQIRVFKDNLYAAIFKTLQNDEIVDFIIPIEATLSTLTLHYAVKLGTSKDIQPCSISIYSDFMIVMRSSLGGFNSVDTYFTGIVCNNKEFFITIARDNFTRDGNTKPYINIYTEVKGTNYLRPYSTQGYSDVYRTTAFTLQTSQKSPISNVYKKASFVEVTQDESDIISVSTGESGSTLEEKEQVFVSVPKEKLTPKVDVSFNATELWDITGLENNVKLSGNSVTPILDTASIIVPEKTHFVPTIGHIYYFNTSSYKTGNENTNFNIYFAQEQPVIRGTETGSDSGYGQGHGKIISCTKAQPLEVHFGINGNNATKDGGIGLRETQIIDLTQLFGEEAAKNITDIDWLYYTLSSYYSYNKIYL